MKGYVEPRLGINCVWLYLCIYLRDHYALIVTPLIINAQRKLLERINSFGGPAVPQPHHVMTQKTSGKEVTNIYFNPFFQDTLIYSYTMSTLFR